MRKSSGESLGRASGSGCAGVADSTEAVVEDGGSGDGSAAAIVEWEEWIVSDGFVRFVRWKMLDMFGSAVEMIFEFRSPDLINGDSSAREIMKSKSQMRIQAVVTICRYILAVAGGNILDPEFPRASRAFWSKAKTSGERQQKRVS